MSAASGEVKLQKPKAKGQNGGGKDTHERCG
jgi:hypothetical protein